MITIEIDETTFDTLYDVAVEYMQESIPHRKRTKDRSVYCEPDPQTADDIRWVAFVAQLERIRRQIIVESSGWGDGGER